MLSTTAEGEMTGFDLRSNILTVCRRVFMVAGVAFVCLWTYLHSYSVMLKVIRSQQRVPVYSGTFFLFHIKWLS